MARKQSDRIKAARRKLNDAVKSDLIPFLATHGFAKNPFIGGPLGSYYPGNDFWTYYLARRENPHEIAELSLYVGPRLTVQFHYNRLSLTEPIADLAEVPDPSPEMDGVLHSRHIRNRIAVHGRFRKVLGLRWDKLFAMRPRRDPATECARVVGMLKEDLGDLTELKTEWEALRDPVIIGPHGRIVLE